MQVSIKNIQKAVQDSLVLNLRKSQKLKFSNQEKKRVMDLMKQIETSNYSQYELEDTLNQDFDPRIEQKLQNLQKRKNRIFEELSSNKIE